MKFSAVLTSFASLFAFAAAQASHNGIGISPSGRSIVNATQAQAAIQGAVEMANSLNLPFNIAILDPFALLVAFLRQDSAYPGMVHYLSNASQALMRIGSIDISMKKAKTVVLFNGATSASFYNTSQPGAQGYLYGIQETNGGFVVFGGGVPLLVDGILIGAIGVSGGTVDQDVMVAEAGAKAIGGVIPSS